jgi:DNA primase
LSHAVLFDDCRTRYASIAGKPTLAQLNLVRVQVERIPAGSEIVAAMDADQAGGVLAEAIGRTVEDSARTDVKFRSEQPDGFKDWNEKLKAERSSGLRGSNS